MSSKNVNEISKRIVGSRLWLVWIWICSGVVCVADLTGIIVMGVEGVNGILYAMPVVFLAIDAVITALSAITNFRFKRALTAPIIYAAIKLAMVVLTAVLFLGESRIFSTWSLVIWLVMEGVSIVCILVSAIYAKGSGKGFTAVVAILTVIMVVLSGLYMYFVTTRGFFGQNEERTYEKRTLVYSFYDDDEDSLMVTGVLSGKGNTIVVPDEFNGLKVAGIDCSIFTHSGVDTVVLECSSNVSFTNKTELSNIAKELSIYVDKGSVDSFRSSFYSLARSSSSRYGEVYADFANRMMPILDEGEVYVAIDLDYQYLSSIGREIPSVWVGKKGSTFSLSNYSSFGYMTHTDETSESDLYWCYSNFDKLILTDIKNGSGGSVLGTKINSSVRVSMDITNVYAIKINEGNDSMYTEPELSRDFQGTGYRYVTENTADGLFSEVSKRTGFTLSWKKGTSEGGTKFTTFKNEIYDKMEIAPFWTMEEPVISSYGTDKEGNIAWYGNTVEFNSAASFADENIKIVYLWEYEGTAQSMGTKEQNGNSFTLTNISPSYAGRYTLTVTAGGDSITSLETTATTYIDLTVNKRDIELSWATNSTTNLVYSGTQITVSVSANTGSNGGTSGIINSDDVIEDITISGANNVKDAKTYNVSASLNEFSDLYSITNSTSSYSFEVTPYELYVAWKDQDNLTYTGGELLPSYWFKDAGGNEITLLGSDDLTSNGVMEMTLAYVSSTDSGVNAGEHTVYLSTKNTNYTLNSETCTHSYEIEKIKVSVSWSNEGYTYSAEAQGPTATTSDILSAEEGSVKLTYSTTLNGTYVGEYGTDAGTYVVTVGINSSNYEMVEGTNTNSDTLTCTYSISPLSTSLTWEGGNTFTYDGSPHTIEAKIAELKTRDISYVTLSYTNANKVDAGTYEIQASLAAGASGDRTGNYVITQNSSSSYTINKRTFSIEATTISRVYDGTAVTDSETYTYTEYNAASGAGLAPTDSLEDVLTLNFTYTAVSGSALTDGVPIDAGSYTATISLTDAGLLRNYTYTIQDSLSCNITINPKTITLTWENPSYTYDGTQKTIKATINDLESRDQDGALVSLTYTENSYVNAGSYTATATLLGDRAKNYTIETGNDSETWSIATMGLTISVKNNLNKTYNAVAYTDTDVYEYSALATGDSLEEIVTVAVEWSYVGPNGSNGTVSSMKNAGTYTITLRVEALSGDENKSGNYKFNESDAGYFTISQKELAVTWSNLTVSYNGENPVGASAKINSSDLEGSDAESTYTYVYTYLGEVVTPKDAGTYTVKVTYDDTNYVIVNDTPQTYVINPVGLTVTFSGYDNLKYSGTPNGPSYSVQGYVSGESSQVSISYTGTAYSGSAYSESTAPTNAGEYTMWVESNSLNYTLSASQKFEIQKVQLEVTFKSGSLTYNGSSQTPVLSITGNQNSESGLVSALYSGETLAGATYSSSEAPMNAGTYTLELELLSSNYTLNESLKKFTIDAATIAISWSNDTFTYSGQGQAPTYSYTDTVYSSDELYLSVWYDGINGTYYSSSSAPVNAGSYRATLSCGNSNYVLSGNTEDFEITPLGVTAAITWDNTTFTYDKNAHSPEASVAFNEGSPSYNLTYSYAIKGGNSINGAPTDAGGGYTVTVEVTLTDSNYTLSEGYSSSQDFTINAATIAILWSGGTFTYNGLGQAPTYSYTGTVYSSDILNLSVWYSGINGTSYSSYSAPVNAGSYRVAVSCGNSNYVLSGSTKDFEITPLGVTATITWADTTFTYDGNTHSPVASVAFDGGSPSYNLTYSYAIKDGDSISGAPKDAGTYTVTVEITLTDSNYTLSGSYDATQDFTINKAVITILWTNDETYSSSDDVKHPTATITSSNGETISFTYTYYDGGGSGELTYEPTDAGSYKVKITLTYPGGEENYEVTGSLEASYTIVQDGEEGE
ncbi:MAG: MBG domain-containing protein [Clostridia bacterium]|nr:MBG domain-containing protein [Clostridia bacterium]